MKKLRFPCLMLAAALVVLFLSAAAPLRAKTKITVKSVQIKNGKKRIKLQKGGTIQLKTSVLVSPNKSAYKKVIFSSSNKNVISVSPRGVLKARKLGTAKITVTSKSNPKKRARISVSVTTDILVKKIVLDRKWIHVDADSDEEIIQLKVKKILPSNAKNKSIKWDTDNETVADIDSDGTIVIGESGKATITAYAADEGGAFADCTIIVSGDDSDDDDYDYDDEDDYDEDDDEFEWY